MVLAGSKKCLSAASIIMATLLIASCTDCVKEHDDAKKQFADLRNKPAAQIIERLGTP